MAAQSGDADRGAQRFPRLSAAQIARLETHGTRIRINQGDILAEPGDRHRPVFVVLSGSIDVVQPSMDGEHPSVVHTAGSFTGEMRALSSVGSLERMRVREDGEVLSIPENQLRAIIQNDAELSELFMRAFILRHVGLIASQAGDVILPGSSHSADTLRIQQFLTRNSFPFSNLDVDMDLSAQALLTRFQIKLNDTPVVLCRGAAVLECRPFRHKNEPYERPVRADHGARNSAVPAALNACTRVKSARAGRPTGKGLFFQ